MLLPLKSTRGASAKQLEAGLVGTKVPYAMIMEAGVIQKLGECLGLVILVVGVCPNFIESQYGARLQPWLEIVEHAFSGCVKIRINMSECYIAGMLR